MPGPRLTVVVTGTDPAGLGETAAGVDAQTLPDVALVVLGARPLAGAAVGLAAERVEPSRRGPLAVDHLGGRTAGGRALSVAAFDGPFRAADAWARAAADAAPFTDLYVVLRPGDVLAPHAGERFAAALAEDPAVGGAWADARVGPLRARAEPFDRPRLLAGAQRPPRAAAVAAGALAAAGGVDPAAADPWAELWARLTGRFVVAHLPEVLLTCPT